MKSKILVLIIALISGIVSPPVTLFMGGNSWPISRGTVIDQGFSFSSVPSRFVAYFYTTSVLQIPLSIKFNCSVISTVTVTLGSTIRTLSRVAASSTLRSLAVGNFTTAVGYNRIYVTISSTGTTGKGLVESIFLNGDLKGLTYVVNNSNEWFYWGRRGPSGHINPIVSS